MFSHLTYFTWLSRSIHVVTNGRISFFFFLMDKIIFHCTCVLGWPKVSFWYFHKMLQESLSGPFGQPSTLFFFFSSPVWVSGGGTGRLAVAGVGGLLCWRRSFTAQALSTCGTPAWFPCVHAFPDLGVKPLSLPCVFLTPGPGKSPHLLQPLSCCRPFRWFPYFICCE